MIEIEVLNHLKEYIEKPVYMGYAEEKTGQYITVEKTNSGIEDRIDYARFAIQSYADSLFDAAKLNNDVKIVMNMMPAVANVGKVKCNTDYNFTDNTTKKYRYQAVYDIWY